jgi:GH25 family lysozyme M1 (1,4-beta-N-acetylmuramidase)
MTHRPARNVARVRLIGLAGLASLGLLSASLPAAYARPAPTPRHSTEAKAVGMEPGNAPMGWRHARLGDGATLGQKSLDARDSRVSASAKLVPMTGVLGIDVSSYQKNVNWASYKSQGRVFAYIKATEGTSYRNPYFASQFDGSAKAGFIRGAYHFANPSGASGKAQADYFVRYGRGWAGDGKTLPGVLDIEYNPHGSTCYGLSKTAMVKWISDFVTQYKKRTTRDAVIYTTAGWWSKCTGNTTKFNTTNPLWVARWGSSAGTLPGKWPYYTFWQYSSNPVDQDKFSAPYARLKVLAGRK